MAMGVPMDWSVVEPAVGILVSSMPAIRAIRYLWKDENLNSYSGGSRTHSTLKSRTHQNGHIQLHDIEKKKPSGINDNDSEEQLVFGIPKGNNISRTTEVELSYGPK